MAPTIIRVKRKFDETQEVDTNIILNCKKQKLSDKVNFRLSLNKIIFHLTFYTSFKGCLFKIFICWNCRRSKYINLST